MQKQTTIPDAVLSSLFGQLAILAKSGIMSGEALRMAAASTPEQYRPDLDAAAETLERGRNIAEAFKSVHGMPDYAIHMLEIAAMTGKEQAELDALSSYYARQAELKQAVRQAVAYPAAMAVLVSGIFLLLLSKTVPIFQAVAAQLGAGENALSSLAATAGRFSNTIFLTFAAAVLLAALAIVVLKRTGRFSEDDLIRGKAALYSDRARFTSAMASMLSCGVNTDAAFEHAITVCRNNGFKARLTDAGMELCNTHDLPVAIENHKILTPMDAGLLRAASRSGILDDVMDQIAARAQQAAVASLEQFLERLQYGLICILCLAVSLVLLAVMAPVLGVLASMSA